MAADILLYNADLVPVGEDQKQHLELTRDLAGRFNHRYGEYFTIPEPYIPQVGARVMSLDDASSKMSKSNPNLKQLYRFVRPAGCHSQKISRATTDSGREVVYDPANKPEVSNLMSIYAECAGMTLNEVAERYEGKMYGPFKKELAEVVVSVIEPLQTRYNEIRESGELTDVLETSARRAEEVAQQTLDAVKERMGFVPRRKL